MRDFTNYILFSSLPPKLRPRLATGLEFLESALDDYYPCSFKDDADTIA